MNYNAIEVNDTQHLLPFHFFNTRINPNFVQYHRIWFQI